MVIKLSKYYEEELSFGKFNDIDDNNLNEYVIFHTRKSPLKGVEKEDLILGINYNNLAGYLKGASFGKLDLEFIMYNGLHNKIKEAFSLNEDVFPLNKLELEKLIVDSKLPNHLKIKNIK
jgi:hypothetical protein